MYKVYLAIGNSDVEDYIRTRRPVLEQQLKDTVTFVGTTVYKEGALQGVKDHHPDVILLRESIQGTMDILELIYKIRLESPKTRIILITKQREVGDAFLAAVVLYHVYDIFIGDRLNIKELLKRIVYPADFSAVAHFTSKISLDSQGQMLFQCPDIDTLVQQRVDQILADKKVEVAEEQVETAKEPEKEEPSEPILEEITSEQIQPNIIPEEIITPEEPVVIAEDTSVTSEEVIEEKIEDSEIVDEAKEPVVEKNDNPVVSTLIDLKNPDFLKDFDFPEDDELSDVVIPTKKETVIISDIEPNPEAELNVEQDEPIISNTEDGTHNLDVVEMPLTPLFPDVESENSQTHQNPYTSEQYIPTNNKKKTPSKKGGFSLFKKKQGPIKTISRQIITFWGAANGVGNSHIAFNTAITMANQGYHVIYIDLNDRFSAIESMTQLGFEDVGLETMLQNVPKHEPNKVMNVNEKNVLTKFGMGIGTISKILPFTDKRDFLYKTYSNLPTSLSFAFFSQNRFSRRTGTEYDIELLKEVNLLLSTEFGYDIIILDAPADVTNRATQLALAYSNKVFVTMTQDKTTLNKFFHDMKFLAQQGLNIRDKCYFIVNKFENTNFTYNNLANSIAMNLQFSSVNLLTIPNMYKEFINAIHSGTPIIMTTKNKEFIKIINDIVALIEN